MKKKGLVFSYHFLPYISAEAIVTYKLLSKNENNLDICILKDLEASIDENIKIPNHIKIFEIKSKSKNWVFLMITYYIYCLKKYYSEKYDFIHSRTSPFFGHLPAMTIKRLNKNIPWIASFSDPISNNPYFIHWYKGKPAYFLFKWYGKYMENYVYKHADRLIFNNEKQAKFMLSKYYDKYEKKITIIPHSYNPEWYPVKEITNDKLIISHLGTLYDFRNAYNLFQALSLLNDTVDNLNNKIVFDFYGKMNKEHIDLIEELKINQLVSIKGNCNYLESLKIMKNSDFLLMIDADLKEYFPENIFFASKLADYIGSSTSIIGITGEKGISSEILSRTNNLRIDNDIQAIYNELLIIIHGKKWESEICEDFSIDRVNRQLNEIIKNL